MKLDKGTEAKLKGLYSHVKNYPTRYDEFRADVIRIVTGEQDAITEALGALEKAHEWIESIQPGGGVSLDHKIGEYSECTLCSAWLKLTKLNT